MSQRFTYSQQIIIAIAPMITGSLSLFGSLTIMIMILKSKKKLSSTYRRLIFGICVCDVIFTVSQVASTLPVNSKQQWGNMGTQQTCDAQGFLSYLGGCAGAMYMMFLSTYFLIAIRYPKLKGQLPGNIETFFHLFPFLLGISGASFFEINGYFNPDGEALLCWAAPLPVGCIENDEIDCIRGENAEKYRFVYICPIIFTFMIIIITMVMMSWSAFKQGKSNRKYQFKGPHSHGPTLTSDGQTVRRDSLNWISRPNKYSDKAKAVRVQAILYVASFFSAYFFLTVNILTTVTNDRVWFFMRLLSRIMLPLQGFINMLVYTRPHVIMLRRAHWEYSWLVALCIIITSGGDNDGNIERERRLSRISIHIPPAVHNIDFSDSSEYEEEEKQTE